MNAIFFYLPNTFNHATKPPLGNVICGGGVGVGVEVTVLGLLVSVRERFSYDAAAALPGTGSVCASSDDLKYCGCCCIHVVFDDRTKRQKGRGKS